ncbi:testis-expressed protein 47 [Eucyclogobius newberryi]|uniref:testis-expressed protein 47 n=1 Tax=Eucyclogobius newberryi TaxID=166745 RepID=UPI003B5C6BA1
MSAKNPKPAPAQKHTDLSEEPEETQTWSMLDVTLERIREKILLQRLFLTAQLPNGLGDRTELAAHYEKLSLQLSKRFPWDNVTGLLLLYPSCLIHVIESSKDVFVTILEDLIELQQTSDCVSIEASKIVFMAHSPHSRQFQQYKILHADVGPARGTKELVKEPTETLVLQVLSSVNTIAKQLEQAKRTEGGSALKDLGMSPDVLISLTTRADLQTPQEYLKLYNSPLHFSMDFGAFIAVNIGHFKFD